MNNSIDAIIFDFGGVILNLQESLTYQAMSQLLDCDQSELMPKLMKNNIFHDFECGKISSKKFLDFIKNLTDKPITNSEIISAWNAMLLDFPMAHVDLLIELKKKYRTFLLSNTNIFHEEAFVTIIKNQKIPYTLQEMFETVWYSHELGLRKPNHDIFLEVINRAGVNPAKTMFFDDRIENILAAQELGLQTQLITKENGILKYFKEFVK